ncbi:hypothetical protein [Paenibacillus ihumii]|uniref:hypothetical protein n=1 Tax=Paenibacillus ihumii TaxID=687436 RepID=UPI0006D77F06|nr:hypothetical protein [Paenibacillus ihumii]
MKIQVRMPFKYHTIIPAARRRRTRFRSAATALERVRHDHNPAFDRALKSKRVPGQSSFDAKPINVLIIGAVPSFVIGICMLILGPTPGSLSTDTIHLDTYFESDTIKSLKEGMPCYIVGSFCHSGGASGQAGVDVAYSKHSNNIKKVLKKKTPRF